MGNNGDNRETVNPSFILSHPLDMSYFVYEVVNKITKIPIRMKAIMKIKYYLFQQDFC